jgi:hypothetical protein
MPNVSPADVRTTKHALTAGIAHLYEIFVTGYNAT